MTTEEILNRIHGIEQVDVLLSKHVPAFREDRRWWCKIEYKQPGVEMKFEGHGPTHHAALEQAFSGLVKVAEFGIGRGWDTPAIEHKADEHEATLRDIPF